MVTNDTATRIVEIQRLLVDANISTERREGLVAEQRRLWDREYFGHPFDAIARDAWLTKVAE